MDVLYPVFNGRDYFSSTDAAYGNTNVGKYFCGKAANFIRRCHVLRGGIYTADFRAEKLLIPVFEKGKKVYESPDVHEIKNFCKEQVDTLWDEVKRFENPHRYYVDLSQKLWDIKNELLKKYSVK